MSEGTDAYADHIKDKNRIGEEYSGQDSDPVLYTFRIRGEKVGLKVRRIKGSTRDITGNLIWGNNVTWGTDDWGWNPFILGNPNSGVLGSALGRLGGSLGEWVTVFEETDPD